MFLEGVIFLEGFIVLEGFILLEGFIFFGRFPLLFEVKSAEVVKSFVQINGLFQFGWNLYMENALFPYVHPVLFIAV